MGWPEPPGKGPEAYREFVTRMRRSSAVEGDGARRKEWAGRPPEDHGRVLVELLRLASAIQRSRAVLAEKGPLPDVPATLRRGGP